MEHNKCIKRTIEDTEKHIIGITTALKVIFKKLTPAVYMHIRTVSVKKVNVL